MKLHASIRIESFETNKQRLLNELAGVENYGRTILLYQKLLYDLLDSPRARGYGYNPITDTCSLSYRKDEVEYFLYCNEDSFDCFYYIGNKYHLFSMTRENDRILITVNEFSKYVDGPTRKRLRNMNIKLPMEKIA